MCIAIPVKILKILDHYATASFGVGKTAIVDISLLEVKVGDYVIVNNGYGIRIVEEEEAKETLEIWEQMQELYKDER